jgi:hypothetical protein
MGGGFGKNKGITVRDLSTQFERIVSEPSMRSFTAVLRISREQVEARGEFGVVRLALFICLGVAAISSIGMLVLQDKVRFTAMKFAIGGLVGASIFAMGLVKNRAHATAAFAQIDAIRDLSVDALLRIAKEESFKPKALDYTQRLYLQELLKKTKRNEPELTAFLSLVD